MVNDVPQQTPTPDEIEQAGPDTLRRILSVEIQRRMKLEELLRFGRDAVKSAAGNLVAFDERLKAFEEVVGPLRKS